MRNRGLRPLPFSNSSVGSFMSPSSLLMTQDEGECHATAREFGLRLKHSPLVVNLVILMLLGEN